LLKLAFVQSESSDTHELAHAGLLYVSELDRLSLCLHPSSVDGNGGHGRSATPRRSPLVGVRGDDECEQDDHTERKRVVPPQPFIDEAATERLASSLIRIE